MKLNFRQGIQIAPMTSGQPSFLTYNPGNNTITIVAGVEILRATVAWKNVNYLIEERETITSAWGPFPLSATYYLYWDISLSTGVVTRGSTVLHPEIGTSAPPIPTVDQHWYDTTNNLMKVWNGVNWSQKARVFAATYISGSHAITEYPLGTQVGISVSGAQDTWFDHGFILYGIDQKAIKNSDGSMVTTAVPISTYHGSFSSPIRLELSNSTALAKEPIAAFCAISAFGDGSVQLASGTNAEKRPIGITTLPVIAGEPVDIVFKGIVYNDQWDWDYTLGKDLYCGDTGIPFQNTGGYTAATRIGAILDNKTILIDIDLFGTATGGGGSGSDGASGFSGYSGYSGAGAGAAGPSTQIFTLTSMNDGYFNDQAVDTWNFQQPDSINYTQPTYIIAQQVYGGGTEFVIQEQAMYEMRCSVKSTCTSGFPQTIDDDFVYRLVVSAPTQYSEMETIHPRPHKRTFLGNNSFSWTDIFRFAGSVDEVVTIAAYIVSYNNTSSSNSYTINVAIEKLGAFTQQV